jgi:hypothetical protein
MPSRGQIGRDALTFCISRGFSGIEAEVISDLSVERGVKQMASSFVSIRKAIPVDPMHRVYLPFECAAQSSHPAAPFQVINK